MGKGYFKKGDIGNPNGRPKGAQGKTTAKIKEAYQMLIEKNLDNMTDWLSDIAENDPKQALELVLKLSEYIIPKLARQELTGADGDDLFQNVQFQFGPNVNDETGRIQSNEETE